MRQAVLWQLRCAAVCSALAPCGTPAVLWLLQHSHHAWHLLPRRLPSDGVLPAGRILAVTSVFAPAPAAALCSSPSTPHRRSAT